MDDFISRHVQVVLNLIATSATGHVAPEAISRILRDISEHRLLPAHKKYRQCLGALLKQLQMDDRICKDKKGFYLAIDEMVHPPHWICMHPKCKRRFDTVNDFQIHLNDSNHFNGRVTKEVRKLCQKKLSKSYGAKTAASICPAGHELQIVGLTCLPIHGLPIAASAFASVCSPGHELQIAASAPVCPADHEVQIAASASASLTVCPADHEVQIAATASVCPADHELQIAASASAPVCPGDHEVRTAASASASVYPADYEVRTAASASLSVCPADHEVQIAASASICPADYKLQMFASASASTSVYPADHERQIAASASASASVYPADHEVQIAASASVCPADLQDSSTSKITMIELNDLLPDDQITFVGVKYEIGGGYDDLSVTSIDDGRGNGNDIEDEVEVEGGDDTDPIDNKDDVDEDEDGDDTNPIDSVCEESLVRYFCGTPSIEVSRT